MDEIYTCISYAESMESKFSLALIGPGFYDMFRLESTPCIFVVSGPITMKFCTVVDH